MKDFKKYFWQEAKPWLWAFLISYFLFSAVALVLGMPWKFLLYALVLALVSFFGWGFWQFSLWRQQVQKQLGHWQELSPELEGKDQFYGLLLQEKEKEQKALKRELLEQEREKEEYFTLWMHQMKTPLTSLNLLLREEENISQRALIENELMRIGEYCEWALAYLKLENPGTELDLIEVDLDEIIRSLLRKYRVQFVYQHISLDFKETKKHPLSDSRWLSMMLEQFLSNALKYTPKGKSIRIFWDEEIDKLVIEDEGIGIRPEDLKHVFSKGYSGLNGRLQDKSSGLGLYLVQRISQKLGHKISLSSELGKGTRIKLELALKDENAPLE